MYNVIITGATGMIGSALAREAVSRGMTVLALVRRGTARLHSLPKSELLQVAECGLDEYDRLGASDYPQAPHSPYTERTGNAGSVFYHLAWDKTYGGGRDDTYIQSANIKYTLDAVSLAKRMGCTVFVGAGSQAEYGSTDRKLNEAVPAFPESGYGIGKLAAGRLAKLMCAQLNMRFGWARILSVYGEGDGEHTLIMYLINTLLDGERPSLTPCDQMWDYMYCGDTAKALLAIGESGADGRTYCLGSGRVRPLREYAECLRDEIDSELPLGFGEKDYYPHQAMYLCADIEPLIKDTGYTPATSFEEGIRATIKYCREKRGI